MSNWVRKFEAIVKPVVIIAVFLLVLVIGFCREAQAEVSIEAGPTFLSGQFAEGGVLMLSERWDKYSVSIGYVSEQWVEPRTEERTFVMENVFAQAQRHVDITENFELGLGVAYFNGTSRVLGSNFEFSLLARYWINDTMSVQLRHWSNAGSARPNMGQDALTFAYHFGGR